MTVKHKPALVRGGEPKTHARRISWPGGSYWRDRQDVGLAGDRISFVGDAATAGVDAAVVVDVDGLMVAPGFVDMHSHAELTEDYGRNALANPFVAHHGR